MMGAKWYYIYLRELFVAELPLRAISSPAFCTSRSAILRSAASIPRRSVGAARRRTPFEGGRSIGCAVQAWCIRYLACSGCPAVPTDSAIYPTRHVPTRSGRAHRCRCSAPDAPEMWLNPPLCNAPSTALHHAFPLPVGDADATDGAMPRASASCAMLLCGCRCTLTARREDSGRTFCRCTCTPPGRARTACGSPSLAACPPAPVAWANRAAWDIMSEGTAWYPPNVPCDTTTPHGVPSRTGTIHGIAPAASCLAESSARAHTHARGLSARA